MTDERKTNLAGVTLANEPDELLTLDEAAEYLSVSKPTLYRMLDRGEVKGAKVGRQWRFRQTDLSNYLERGPVAVALSTVPLQVLDTELDFFAGALRAIHAALPVIDVGELDQWEQKTTLLLASIAKLAAVSKASDIHLEPVKEGKELIGLLRFRTDGMLQIVRRMPVRLLEALALRCRQLADMGTQDRGAFFDDHIRLQDGEDTMDLRVSILPGFLGESLECRLLVNTPTEALTLENMGFFPEDLSVVRDWLRGGGLILTTGPTGCGKTTVMYALLQEIAGPDKCTVSIEDPIEYQLPWVTQLAAGKGVGFASALRAFLRHDPDAILIGEMRDLETMDLAIHAAVTGHLVFTSVHVENTLRTMERIVDVFPLEQQDQIALLLASTLKGIISMRLVRSLCPHCKQPAPPSNAVMAQAWQLAENGGYTIPDGALFHQAVGCEHCRGRGFQGRTAIYEVLEPTPELRESFLRKVPFDGLLPIAVKNGLRTLTANGIRKAVEGVTTIEEVLRQLM